MALNFIKKIEKYQDLEKKNFTLFFKKVIGIEKKKSYSFRSMRRKKHLITKFNNHFNVEMLVTWLPCGPGSYERGEILQRKKREGEDFSDRSTSAIPFRHKQMLINCAFDIEIVEATYGENWAEILAQYI